MTDSATVKPGGGYVEDPHFVPNASDMRKQFNTSGLGASGRIEETSAVFDLDKAQTAEQIVKALDPKDSSVSADRVLLPDGDVSPEDAKKDLLNTAKERLKKPVILGGPSPAEEEAAEEGDDNPTKKDAAATSGPRAESGRGTTSADSKSDGNEGGAKAKSSSSSTAKKTAAKKTTSSSSSTGTDKDKDPTKS